MYILHARLVFSVKVPANQTDDLLITVHHAGSFRAWDLRLSKAICVWDWMRDLVTRSLFIDPLPLPSFIVPKELSRMRAFPCK